MIKEKIIHRVQCAAITNGCMSALLWEETHLGEVDRERHLTLNGWWYDHGKWVCGAHNPKTGAVGNS